MIGDGHLGIWGALAAVFPEAKEQRKRGVGSLERDWERMVAFYQFPREHWKHLRTSNPVESRTRRR